MNAAADPFVFHDGLRYGDVTRVAVRRVAIARSPAPRQPRGFGILPMIMAALSIGCVGYGAGMVFDVVVSTYVASSTRPAPEPPKPVRVYGFTL